MNRGGDVYSVTKDESEKEVITTTHKRTKEGYIPLVQNLESDKENF